MTDHELHKYIKENYDPPKDESIVLLIKFEPEFQLEEHRFKCGDDQLMFLLRLPHGTKYALLSYYEGIKEFSYHGKNYIGRENLATGKVYRWSYHRQLNEPIDMEKVKEELRQLFTLLNS